MRRNIMVVGTVSLIGGIAAMLLVDGPEWWLIELPLYLVVAWAAGRQFVGTTGR